MQIDPEVARRIRLLVLDVDGVLTDNGIWLGPVAGERVELKRFDVQDGLGLMLLRPRRSPSSGSAAGTPSPPPFAHGSSRWTSCSRSPGPRKLQTLEDLLERRGLAWGEVAYAGDDLADLQILRRVGLPLAVANAVGRCGRWRAM